MAKILFITLYDQGYLGTRFLSSYLLENGHTPHILNLKHFAVQRDINARELYKGYQISFATGFIEYFDPTKAIITEKEYSLLEEYIKNINPDIIGITTRSLNNIIVSPIINFIKNIAQNALFVAGGFGPTLDATLYLSFGFDIIARADGEETLLEIANIVDSNKINNISHKIIDRFEHIQNCSFIKNGQVQHNKLRPQERNLGKYPAPLYGDKYFASIEDDQIFTEDKSYLGCYATLLGRGCIGACSYCSGGQWYKQYQDSGHKALKRRNRPLDCVIEELKVIDKSKYHFVLFHDEMFTASVKDMIHFFERYKEEVGLPFFLYCSYEQFNNNPILFEKASEAGWASTCVGIQTGSEKLARNIYTRNHKNKDYIKYANKLFELNIKADYHFLGGNCYESEEDFQNTLDLLKLLPFDYTDIKAAFLFFAKLIPLPKTPILELAPKIITEPPSSHDFCYQAALIHLRRIMNDVDFEEIRAIKFYKTNPALLLALYRNLLERMQVQEIDRLIEQYKGQDILFYGGGDIFKSMRRKFKKSNIIGLLLDKEYIKEDCKEIEGVPVILAQEVQNLDGNSPIIVCNQKNSCILKRNLIRNYKIDKSRIHTITIMYPKHSHSGSNSIL